MSNNDFINSLEKKGGVIAIDAIVWNGKKVTVFACIKPGHHFETIGKHDLNCHFFIGYIGKFVCNETALSYYDETCILRKPTLKEYLNLMEEAKKHKIGYNRKANKIYRV